MPRDQVQTVRLKTARGTVRRRLPRVTAPRGRAVSLEFLEDALAKRGKTFRKRLRKGVPRRARGIDDAVRGLRTGSRRLLSVLTAVERVGARKAARRLAKGVDRIIGRLGRLRDLTVQREMLSRLDIPAAPSALRSYERSVARDLRRSARKTRRWLDRKGGGLSKKDERRLLRKLRRPDARRQDADGRRELLRELRSTFDELQSRRAAVDPSRVETVHEMRLELKRFRYLVEALDPLLARATQDAIEALQALQTTMGDLHDIEVLSSSLVEFANGDHQRAAALAPALAELEAKHSTMLRSFLESADPILVHWQGALPQA